MGLPNISITFKTTAAAAIARSEKGVVGLILRDSTTALQNKGFVIHSAADIPAPCLHRIFSSCEVIPSFSA